MTETLESTKALSTINSYSLPAMPNDSKKLAYYITMGAKYRDAIKILLKNKLTPEIYNLALDRAIELGEQVLQAELRLSYMLKDIKTRQGKRTDLEYKKTQHEVLKTHKSKKEIIEKDFGLTEQQAKQISRLTDWAVEDAIKTAKENREIPTRAMALTLVKEKNRKENNKDFKLNGIYMDNAINLYELTKLNPIRSSTLFANVGICEWHLKRALVNNVNALELLEERIDWHKEVYPDCEMITMIKDGKITGDIFEKEIQDKIVKAHIEKKASLMILTPACQTFTVAGKRDFNDIRTKLFIPMLDVIKRVDSVNKYVLIENVKEYIKASPKHLQHILEGQTIVGYIRSELEKLGYEVNIDILNAADFGTISVTPQSRERVIILASKNGIWKFPKKLKKRTTLWEAIGKLPSLEAGDDFSDYYPYHKAPDLEPCEIEFLKRTPSGKSAWENAEKYKPVNKDGSKSNAKHKASFSREDWNKPASTITGDSDYIGGHNTVHPGRPKPDGTWSDARVYTNAEKLILMGLDVYGSPEEHKYRFPDWANPRLITEVLGESFLPLLAESLVSTIPNRPKDSPDKREELSPLVEPYNELLEHMKNHK
ncbi:MAG: DNA cytosine methyltransferase [Alphaproteobacteria bacterium]